MTCLRSTHVVAATLLAGALAGADQAANFQWNAASGQLPSEVSAFARVAAGIGPSDTFLPSSSLRTPAVAPVHDLHCGDI